MIEVKGRRLRPACLCIAGDREATLQERPLHPNGKLNLATQSEPATKVIDSMTSLPASSFKPPAAEAPAKAVCSFDSVASMPASQKAQPAPLKGEAPLSHGRMQKSGKEMRSQMVCSNKCMGRMPNVGRKR